MSTPPRAGERRGRTSVMARSSHRRVTYDTTVGDRGDPLDGRRPYARIMVLAVLSLLVALLLPAPVAGGPCSDVLVIGARGSGQPAGYGEQVGPVVDAAVEALSSTGRSVEAIPLDYPALSLADSFGFALFNGEYEASVQAGARAVRDQMQASAGECPSTEFVLIGYSQGAQAIKAALVDTQPSLRITAVVLLADPTRDHEQPGVLRLGDPTVERPGAFGAVPLPDHVRAVSIDVCAPGDGVCERGRDGLIAHSRGYDDVEATVASAIRSEVADRLRQPRLR